MSAELAGMWTWALEVASRKFYMGCSLSLFLLLTLIYNAIFLGRILPAAGQADLVAPLALIFNVLLGFALASYFRAHFMDPGVVPERWRQFVLTCGNDLPVACPREEWQPSKATYCRRCNMPRPERAHHCSLCGICMMRFDHHCPWIDNCVGFHNHKMFLLAMIYGCITSLFALGTALPELRRIGVHAAQATDDTSAVAGAVTRAFGTWRVEGLAPSDLACFYILIVLCFFLSSLLAWLLAMHFPFAWRNCTTVEANYANMQNPFDLGNGFRNLAQVFGAPGLDWLLPIRPRRPLGDGVSFPQRSEYPDEASWARPDKRDPDAASAECGLLVCDKAIEDVFDLEMSETCEDEQDAPEAVWRRRYRVRVRPPEEIGGGTSFRGRASDEESDYAVRDAPLTVLLRWLSAGSSLLACQSGPSREEVDRMRPLPSQGSAPSSGGNSEAGLLAPAPPQRSRGHCGSACLRPRQRRGSGQALGAAEAEECEARDMLRTPGEEEESAQGQGMLSSMIGWMSTTLKEVPPEKDARKGTVPVGGERALASEGWKDLPPQPRAGAATRRLVKL